MRMDVRVRAGMGARMRGGVIMHWRCHCGRCGFRIGARQAQWGDRQCATARGGHCIMRVRMQVPVRAFVRTRVWVCIEARAVVVLVAERKAAAGRVRSWRAKRHAQAELIARVQLARCGR
jgi:hypothetical protein